MRISTIYQLALILIVCSICSVQSQQNKSSGIGFGSFQFPSLNIFNWKKNNDLSTTDAPLPGTHTIQSTKFYERFKNWINKFKGVVSKAPTRSSTDTRFATRIPATHPTSVPFTSHRMRLSTTRSPSVFSRAWRTRDAEDDDYYKSDSVSLEKNKAVPPLYPSRQSRPTARAFHPTIDESDFDSPFSSEDDSADIVPGLKRFTTRSTRRTTTHATHHAGVFSKISSKHVSGEGDFDSPFSSDETDEGAAIIHSLEYPKTHSTRHTITHATHPGRDFATTSHTHGTGESDFNFHFSGEDNSAAAGDAKPPTTLHTEDNVNFGSISSSEEERQAYAAYIAKHSTASHNTSVHVTKSHMTTHKHVKTKPTLLSYLDYFNTRKDTIEVKTSPHAVHNSKSRLDPAHLGPEVRYHYSQMDTHEDRSADETQLS